MSIVQLSKNKNSRPTEEMLPDFPAEALRVGRVLQKDGEVYLMYNYYAVCING